jgi:hypothetical protein
MDSANHAVRRPVAYDRHRRLENGRRDRGPDLLSVLRSAVEYARPVHPLERRFSRSTPGLRGFSGYAAVAPRSSSATDSMCGVCGNMSTGRTVFSS